MIRTGLDFLARTLLVAASLVIVSCGSGSVGPPPVVDPGKITILPDTATLYSGLPTTFSVTGGTGAYIVTSSNQAIIPIAGASSAGTFTVVPNPVVTDTPVTLTARDTGTAAPVSATLTVKPGTVSNTITITAGSSACAPAICSGGDAVVEATISQGGIPIPARGVRFDVVSGEFLFITSAAGQPETLASSVVVITDERGVARARLRTNTNAANQTGILQVTDLGSGAFQRTTLFIAQASASQSGFFTVPTTVTYSGPDNQTCASGISSEVFIFGGSPPYTISNTAPTAFTTNTNVVGQSGGSFRVTPTGICADNVTFAIRDASGRIVTVTLSNKVGTIPVPTPAAFDVTPTSVILNSCAATANVLAFGGTGQYFASSSNSAVMATVAGQNVTIRRAVPSDATGVTGIVVGVTDGKTSKTVTVTLAGTATTTCP